MPIFGYLLATLANPVAFPQTVRCAVRSAGRDRMKLARISLIHPYILMMFHPMLPNHADENFARPDGGQTHT